jgi:ferrous iron transport protein A
MSTLGDLKIGERARVVSIDGMDDVSVRLLEMGLTPGVDVKLLGFAPLGDPAEFELRGYRLSLRRSEMTKVVVQLAGRP